MLSREEIEKRLREIEERALRGDEKAAAKQHSEGKLTARERIAKLLDPGSFVEEFMLAETRVTDFGMAAKRQPSDGVVTGSGRINGRPVYLFAQDRTILAGAVGSAHAEKISYVIDQAAKVGCPVIGLFDSVGARIQEGLDVTRAIGQIFHSNVQASGVVPQISAIMGPCIGVASYSPALMDFALMVKGTSQMLITGPAVVKEVLGEEVSMEDLGGWKVHAELSGCSDLVAQDEAECLKEIRRLLSYLPQNAQEGPPRVESGDDPNRSLNDIEAIVPEEMRKSYNVVDVIKRIVDRGEFLELKPKWARSMAIGLARLDGRGVGFVANQPMFLAGSIDVDAADKGSRFIRFCDAFNIPIITLVDVPGFYPGKRQEQSGIIRHGAKLLYAYAEATVPKVTLYLRKGYGGAKQAMCTREMGADQVFVWPGVELAVMGGGGAVNVLYRREIESAQDPEALRKEKLAEFNERFAGPFDALSKQYAQAVIRPEETRRRLIQALELLSTKRAEGPRRKHGIMPV
ncbi:MAG TPA: acyl-CoA carboxylase subunit beta [Methylomirabilota bacterium]|nr:acyl-CoA carboxylase subunit beta [Methylomirabilota bacterium]